ncbi:MAG: DNA-formamidopyrimidine glycosylase [Actinomycetota bacterium]|nr:DNA-formamidopyrimidine glycosylase [Actinomycetota bacterium]
MPELPEVEITARRLTSALEGAEVESALAPGVATLKTFDPPLDALEGARVLGVRRIGKMLATDFESAAGDALTLLVHLMSAGRMQLFDKRASLKDRRSRVLVRIAGEGNRELRLREFGTRQSAWAKLLQAEQVADEEMVATLGPDAWPAPDPDRLAELLDQPGFLHPLLRKQRTIAGVGRSWVDEILWEAKLSPFKKGAELAPSELGRLHEALGVLGAAIDHYEEVIGEQVPDKLPMPLRIHRREGEPCPRCGATIEAVFYSEHQMNYCPEEQTGGKVLKDRRLSRLLK